MSFFQNLFNEFQGYLVLGDRQASTTYKIPGNRNPQSKQVAWNKELYDLSTDGILTINFSIDKDYKTWNPIVVDCTTEASDSTAVSSIEVCSALNSDAAFSQRFFASILIIDGANTVVIERKSPEIKWYIANSSAEKVFGFNKNAGVAELPHYFVRHTIENGSLYSDSQASLIVLDENNADDQLIITNAGFDHTQKKEDWELLRGRSSGLFTFQKLTVDGSDRITQIIEYPAGAQPGDFARKIKYVYTGSNSNPSQVTETPYVLTESDLLTP